MKILKNKKLLAIAAIVVCTSTSANATSKSGCHSGGGSTGGSNTGGTTTLPVCDDWQGEYIYDLYNGKENVQIGTETTTGLVQVDGTSIRVSAWADTESNSNSLDDRVVQSITSGDAKGLPFYWSDDKKTDAGMGLINSDEVNESNVGWSHSIDNYGTGDYKDYDMVLFSFSDTVSLDGALFSWVNPDRKLSQEVTVVGLTQQGFDSLSSGHATWGDIASNTSNFVSASSFHIEECAPGYEADFGEDMGFAKYWLVGAYNTAFGSNSSFTENDDGFKLASLGFTKGPDLGETTEVSAPSSFALLILGGGLMAWRRRKA